MRIPWIYKQQNPLNYFSSNTAMGNFKPSSQADAEQFMSYCIKLLKPTGHVMHHQFNIQQLYALPTLYLCVLYLSQKKTATCATYSINWLVFIIEMKSVYSAVRTGSLNKANYRVVSLLKPIGYVMYHQFNIQQPYALPTLYLCVLYLSQNKQRLVPLTA